MFSLSAGYKYSCYSNTFCIYLSLGLGEYWINTDLLRIKWKKMVKVSFKLSPLTAVPTLWVPISWLLSNLRFNQKTNTPNIVSMPGALLSLNKHYRFERTPSKAWLIFSKADKKESDKDTSCIIVRYTAEEEAFSLNLN